MGEATSQELIAPTEEQFISHHHNIWFQLTISMGLRKLEENMKRLIGGMILILHAQKTPWLYNIFLVKRCVLQ